MKIRIIGVSSCSKCLRLVYSYNRQKIKYEYWDGDKKEYQDELAKMKIDEFPVVQIVSDENKVLHTWDNELYPNGVSYKTVKSKMDQIQ